MLDPRVELRRLKRSIPKTSRQIDPARLPAGMKPEDAEVLFDAFPRLFRFVVRALVLVR